jgi:hypothetical protein
MVAAATGDDARSRGGKVVRVAEERSVCSGAVAAERLRRRWRRRGGARGGVAALEEKTETTEKIDWEVWLKKGLDPLFTR